MKNVFAPLPGCVLDRSSWCNRLDMDQDVALQAESRVVDVAMMLNNVAFFVHSHIQCYHSLPLSPNSRHLLYRKRPFRGETLQLPKIAHSVQSVIVYGSLSRLLCLMWS
jgi:hypothetical protein